MVEGKKLIYAAAAPVVTTLGERVAIKVPLHRITTTGVEKSPSADIWLSYEEAEMLGERLLRSTIL